MADKGANMLGAVLKDVTPESVAAELIGAGVKPGERVTVIVRRRARSLLEAADQLGTIATANGLTEEVLGDLIGANDAEFERLFGHKPARS
jgi:hypothetical protein